jgi:hypothetical protein
MPEKHFFRIDKVKVVEGWTYLHMDSGILRHIPGQAR